VRAGKPPPKGAMEIGRHEGDSESAA